MVLTSFTALFLFCLYELCSFFRISVASVARTRELHTSLVMTTGCGLPCSDVTSKLAFSLADHQTRLAEASYSNGQFPAANTLR